MSMTAVPDTIELELLGFLKDKTKAEWTADRDLFADGGLSSLFAMELVVHLEQRFGITIAGSDLQLKNFRTVTSMVELVVTLQRGVGA
jgi:methoxymalonate biosynthesis acyl carrier protein